MNSITSIPNDVFYEFFSYLSVEDLKNAEQVCKYWQPLANNDKRWATLLMRTFPSAPSQNMTKKEAMCQYGAPPIKDEAELFKKYVSFRCTLQLDKKRAFICFSENIKTPLPERKILKGKTIPPLFVIEQGYGQRGAEKEFSGAADETEICIIVRENYNAILKYTYNKTSPIKTEDNFNKTLPINTNVESKLNGINICTHASINSKTLKIRDEFSQKYKFRDDVCNEIVIKGIDVGWGNTLGYYSGINGWKKPFKFSCAKGEWSGRVPSYICFQKEFCSIGLKFVKIDPNGKITWETSQEGNRNCDTTNYRWKQDVSNYVSKNNIEQDDDEWLCHPGVVQLCWNHYLKDFPIKF